MGGARASRGRRRRRVANATAAALIALATLLVLVPLFFVLYYLIADGLSSINWDFFVKLPAPVGEAGGGVANAVVGTGILLLIASLIGVVLGVGAGILIAEYPANPLVPPVRLMADVLTGIPAIVMGLVAYGAIVVTLGRFSALSGRRNATCDPSAIPGFDPMRSEPSMS